MRIFAALFIFILSLAAQAQSRIEFGIAGGFRSMQVETDISSATTNSKTGYQVGPLAYLPLNDFWGLRTGFLYTQRFANLQNTNKGDVDIQYAYFDVPGTVMIRFADFAGAFAGPVLAFNQSKDVTCTKNAECAALDVKSIIVPWQLGLSFRFLSQLGAELYYEYVPGDLSTNVSNMKTVGGNLVFYFE